MRTQTSTPELANTLDESANIGDESQNTLDESANIGDESQNTLDESANIDDGDDNAPVWYCDVWGVRDAKYDFLRTATLESIRWTPLTPRAPMYLFVPQDTALEAEYLRGWRIPDIFPVCRAGIANRARRADHPPHAQRRVAHGVRVRCAGA
jgi:hypothetical protein